MTRPPSAPSITLEDLRREVRERYKHLIDRVFVAASVLIGAFLAVAPVMRGTPLAWSRIGLALGALIVSVLGVAGRAPWSPPAYVALLTTSYVATVVSYGPLLGSAAMAMAAVMIAAVFLRPRVVVATFVALTAAPLAIGLLVRAGALAAPVFRFAEPTAWPRMVTATLAGATAAAVVVHLTFDRLHRARLEIQAALAQARARHAEREQVEREIAQARRADLIVELAAEVGADIGAALAIVTARAEALAAEVTREEARHGLADVITAASTAASTMRSLTVLNEDLAATEHRCDVMQAARDLPRIVRRMLPTGITLDIVAEGEALAPMSGTDLLRILSNLVLNARDAITGTGAIHVRVRVDATQVAIEVQDDGHGMDAATQARVFEPFFTTKPVGRGTGLGLTTARVLVERAGGTMTLTSAAGAGTTFRIVLPRVRP